MLRKNIYYAAVLIIILIGIGTVYYTTAEGWSYVDSFYFSTMTLTTIGYGDLAPTHEMSKIFTSFYALFGIGVMLYVLSSVIGTSIFMQEKNIEKVFYSLKNFRQHQEKKIEKQEHEIEKLEKKIKEPKRSGKK